MEDKYEGKEVFWAGLAGKLVDFKADKTGRMRSLEIFPHSKPSPLFWEDVPDSSLSEWLNKTSDRSSSGPMAPQQDSYGGQRLLFGVIEYDTQNDRLIVPFREGKYDEIREKFGFRKDFVPSLTKKGLRAEVYSTRKDDGRILKCFLYKFLVFGPSYYQLALSYDKRARLTHGLLLYTNGHNWQQHFAGLEERAVYWEDPLILANLVFKLVIDSCANNIDVRDTELNHLEEVMGQHKHKNRPARDPFHMDYKAVTQSLNFSSRTLGLVGMRLRVTQLTLEKILQHNKGIADELRTPPKDHQVESQSSSCTDGLEVMGELTENLVDYCKTQLFRVEYQEKRAKTQSTAVYSFVAQNDAKVMKTISTLGMLFLPGAFIAAIFAMPIFNWNGQNGPSINALGFKYYCAVTIPLTILVFVYWAIWPRLIKWVIQARSISAVREDI